MKHGNYPCFGYDNQHRCTGMFSGNTQFSAYAYSGDRLATRSLLNGLFTGYDYQNDGRVWDVWHYDGVRNKNVSRHCYGYAPNGQISWFDREADGGQSGSSLENGRGDAFFYWPDGSLAAAVRDVAAPSTGSGAPADGWPGIYSATADSRYGGSVNYAGGSANTALNTYAYSLSGSRTSVSQMNQGTINYYDHGNHENQYAYSNYDNNGNTTDSAVGWTYRYDAENQLTSAAGPNGQTLGFSYDGLGRVVGQVANGVATLFYYAGSQRIEERDLGSSALRYLYFFDAPGSDQLLFRSGGSSGNLWYQADLLGNTSHLSDNAGNVVEAYLYDAYGTPSAYGPAGNLLGGSGVDNRYLFKGSGAYEWLAQAGLYYCRARFYLPQHGRFLQPDPIGQAGGLNIYTYCANDPVNRTDSSGHASVGPSQLEITTKQSIGLGGDLGWAFASTGNGNYDPTSGLYNATYTRTDTVTAYLNPSSSTVVVVTIGFGGHSHDSGNGANVPPNAVMAQIGQSLGAAGFNTIVVDWTQGAAATQFVEDAINNGAQRAYLIGYSLGAVTSINIADKLMSDNINVKALITLDPVEVIGGQLTVPNNVDYSRNEYQTNGGIQGVIPGPSQGDFEGTSVGNATVNEDMTKTYGSAINHQNLPATEQPGILKLLLPSNP